MAASYDKRSTKKTQNIRLPLIGSLTNRSSDPSKDQRFVNIFPETRKVEAIESTKIFLNKRPGLTPYKDYGTGEGRGCIYFNSKFYVAVGDTVYEDSVTPTAKITMTTSTGPVGMIAGNSATLGDYIFISDGVTAWTINTSGTVVKIDGTRVRTATITNAGSGYTDGTYALGITGTGAGATGTYTVAGNVVTAIDITDGGTGYTVAPTLSFPSGGGTAAAGTAMMNDFPTPHTPTPVFVDGYVLLAKGSDIYNCVLDTPSSWIASEYISAEMYPDPIRSLAKQNNQVVAFGGSSTEFFYDAANPTASPLSRNDATALQYGIAAPYCVYQAEKTIIFVSQSESGGRGVFQIDGFQPKKVSDEFVDRILNAEGAMTGVRGFGVRTMGHLFFVINLPTLSRTLVYDTEEKLWHEWSTNTANAHTVFAYNCMCDASTGAGYLLHNANGTLYKLDPTAYQDDTTNILVDLTTNRYDMDTICRKFMSNFRIVGDRYSSGNSVDLRWTDDDYQTWSNTKTIDLTDDFPNFARMGAFRRRAFNLKQASNYPLRMESIEITFVEGSS